MGKLLRVLVILLFILSAAALTLGIMLFNKRELLKLRTQKLEDAIVALGLVTEDQPPEERPADFVARDISPCSSEILDNPEVSDFWDDYKVHLELPDEPLPTMNIRARQNELMTLYQRDRETLKIKRDANGYKITTGAGTMQAVLDELIEKATAQLDLLNQTRQQLKELRQELVDTIAELNMQKGELRRRLAEIVDLKNTISQLEAKVADLEQTIAALREEIRSLNDQIAEKQRTIDLQSEQIAEKDEDIQRLEKDVKELQELLTSKPDADLEERLRRGGDATVAGANVEPGVKGAVATVDGDWNFVVMNLNKRFMREIEKVRQQDRDFRGFELMVRRPGRGQEFVTKIRIRQISLSEGLAVGDILSDWTQMPVRRDDVVFF